MQTEKLALIGLVVVIIVALTGFLYVNYGDELFKAEPSIEIGDCADVSYIGRHADDDTVFDSSYSDVENKTGSTPLNVYVLLDIANYTASPEGYDTYLPGLIEGFMNGIIGMKEGETKTVSIPADKAYGANKLGVGDSFTTESLAIGMSQTVEVTEFTDQIISVKWIDVENVGNFTSPQMVVGNLSSMSQEYMVIYPPPCYIFKNCSQIVNVTDENVTVLTTPKSHENLSETVDWLQSQDATKMTFIFPDATTAEWDDTTITVTSIPEVGSDYIFTSETMYGIMTMDISIVSVDVANNSINASITMEGETVYQLVNTTMIFNRSFVMSRFYNDIPIMYLDMFAEDFEREGLSANALAGEDLTFEITVEKIYKTSQTEES